MAKKNNMTYRDVTMTEYGGLDFLTYMTTLYVGVAETYECYTKEKVIRKIYDFYLDGKKEAEALIKEGEKYEKKGKGILVGMRPEDYFLIMAYIDTKLTDKDIKLIQKPYLLLINGNRFSQCLYEKFPVEEMKQVIAKKDYHFDDRAKEEEMEFTK